MMRILYACVHNAGRSQMAAAFFNARVDPGRVSAISAGTEPAEHVHPDVLSAMKEVGIDFSHASPQRLTPELASGADHLITLGCDETGPIVPGLREDWALPDPRGQSIESVREIRDEVRRRVEQLISAGEF